MFAVHYVATLNALQTGHLNLSCAAQLSLSTKTTQTTDNTGSLDKSSLYRGNISTYYTIVATDQSTVVSMAVLVYRWVSM